MLKVKYVPGISRASMVTLPPPPWARAPRERCPNCLDKIPDDRAIVCDRCGYQLRLPRVSLVGLALLAASVASFFVSVFGGFLFPWPRTPFPIPFLERPTPEDLQNLSLWVGVVLLLAGIAAASAGAYVARRSTGRVVARGGRPA